MKFLLLVLLQTCMSTAAAEGRRGLRPILPGAVEAGDTIGGNGAEFTVTNVHTCGTHQAAIPDDDMWIRFNKVSFPSDVTPPEAQGKLPLLPVDYPVCSETAAWLRKSLCWSVILQEDCSPEECHGMNIMQVINKLGGLPTHPSWDGSSPYWTEFRQVIEARQARLRGDMAVSLLKRTAKIWENFTLQDAAEAVHNEYPGKNQALLIEQFLGEGAQMDRNVVPTKNFVDFLRYEIALAELNTWAIAMVGPVNFGTKWTGGRARPEEIAWYITTHDDNSDDLIARGIPADIVNDVIAMNLTHPHEFTAYPEGCPLHPSWPAMHSAASVVSFWLPVVMDLTREQICEAKALDWGVSFGRTIAGVHFATDNTFGLNLGQEMLANQLPLFLQRKFGANPAKVRAKIASLRHNWEEYLSGECFSSSGTN